MATSTSVLTQIRKLKDIAAVVTLLKEAVGALTKEVKAERTRAEKAEKALGQKDKEILSLQRQLEDIKAVLAAETPAKPVKEAKPKAARKPRKSKAPQTIVDVVLDEPTPEELEEEY